MKKKILAMMSALILTITCVAPLNVYAYHRPNWYTYYKLENGTIFDNDWVSGESNTVAWGQDLRNDDSSAVVLYRFGMANTLYPGQNMNLNIDLQIDGLRLNQYQVKVKMRDTNYKEIELLDLSQLNFENDTSGRIFTINGNINYENNSSSQFYLLYIEITVVDGSNLTYSMTKVNDLTLHVTPDLEDLQVDTNNKVSGIFDTVKNIFSGITELPSKIANQLSGFFQNVVDSINGGNSQVDSKDDLENSTSDLNDKLNQYDDLESGFVEDFDNSIGAIKPNNDLLTNNDFINTSTFVATQMTRIYESNDIVRMTITFGLIIGLAFTVIGISVRR